MSGFYYKDAQKQAQKEFRSCTSKGQYPYLPALDVFVPAEQMTKAIDLGNTQIPMEFIAGTRTSSRTNTFARNFMPLMGENTEFADKWKRLCESHLQEGIRDAVKVYEYMNRYYVEEGNKRVSVLKFFGAGTVYAHVIRILPERNGSKGTELYFEFVEFYQYSHINFLEFSKLGSYAAFQQQIGKEPQEVWSEEDRKKLSVIYYYFRQAYEANGGNRLNCTVGDALLAYIKIYGYHDLYNLNAAEMKQAVARVWEEITLLQEDDPIDVKAVPGEEKKPNVFTRVFCTGTSKNPKIAFIHDKSPELSGWTHGHELGREYVQRVFDGQIMTQTYLYALETEEIIEQAIADGNTIIFTTSPRLLPDSLRAAIDHPDIIILNCSLNISHRYIRTYYARMYEAKFIIGAIAGSLSESGKIGYVCNYPIYGQIAGINAFALGARMVNPRTNVYLEWSSVDGVDAAVKHLTDQGISLISLQDFTRQNVAEHYGFGLMAIQGEVRQSLAVPLWQWGVYYEKMIRCILNKTFQSEYTESSKALNYYWGMADGVIQLRYSDALSESTYKLAETLRAGICSGSCIPFQGPLRTQDGTIILEAGQQLTLEQIVNMDRLMEHIIGQIPDYEQLDETGKATVDFVGVDGAK